MDDRLPYMQTEVHALAKEKGWWPEDVVELGDGALASLIAEKIALIHSELSEALEEARKGRHTLYYPDASGKPEGMNIELADAVIRIMDLCEFLGIDLLSEIRVKHAYNAGRSYRHGGKLI